MTKEAQALLEQARTLSREDQAWLAEELYATLPPTPEWEKAWAEEAQRRLERLRSGEDKDVPAEEVFRELEQRFP